MKICALADYISSINNEDFGEDILVQTCINEEMDESKIWIQVKGFRGKPNGKSAAPKSIAVSNGHLSRWVKSADLAVIVRWDVENDCGWYLVPDGSEYAKRIPFDKSGRQTVRFDKKQAFDVPAVRVLAWKTRFRHAMNKIGALTHLRSYGDVADEETLELQHDLYDQFAQIALDIGTLVPGKDNGWQISANFQEAVFEYARSREDNIEPSPIGMLLLAELGDDFSQAEMIHTVVLESVCNALRKFLPEYVPVEVQMQPELFAEIADFLAMIIGSAYARDSQILD